jgi:hypothetical protein
MKGMGQKISGALKKMMGTSSSHSRGGSSSRHTPEPTPNPSMMDYKEEQGQHTEEEAKSQAEDMEMDDDDAPYLSTCDTTVKNKPTPSSSIGALVTPKPSTRISS